MEDKFSWFWLSTELKFNDLEKYAVSVEEFLQSKSKEFEDLVEKETLGLNYTQQEKLEYFDHKYADDYLNYKNSFPNILRRSLFLHIYSTFEQLLMSLCLEYEDKLSNKIKLDDLRHKGIKKAQVFLKRAACIPFPDDVPEWTKIKNYNEIRNHFAHDGRRVCSENSSLYKAIINTEGVISKLMIKDPVSNEILHDFELTEEFCINAIETIKNFLFLLDAKIPIEHVR